MKGVILDLGSDGTFRQFPSSGDINGMYGPMEKRAAQKLMRDRGGVPVPDPDKPNEWTVGERDGLGRIVCSVRFVFVPLSSPNDLKEKIRRMRSH
ncbi:MAG: hypothetical protein UT43_C0036G0003 [Parcubacteria group bacterium GW2011_GWC1_39_29]|nr:MAG: hypothetical protein UT43_C0036G0003 [Parcubacteria group bacterium GW2011_GWC1_39_29]